jgi:Na+-driven multidrug efflux pump
MGRHRSYLVAQGVGLATNLLLSPTLVVLGFGLEGVALATAASYGVYALTVRWAGLAATRS